MTSPPYCNRYDYTRTYVLELALLGIDEQGLLRLRQEMLSCTVENRTKGLLDFIKVYLDFRNTSCVLTEFGSYAARTMVP